LLIAAGAALVPSLLLSSCSSGDGGDDPSAGISVVASTSVYAGIAQVVGGSLVSTTAFISSPGQDPHSYQASGRDILAVSKADLVIENGGGYDSFMGDLIDGAGGASRLINVVDQSGLPDRDSADFNEHVWYDVDVVRHTADDIASALAAIDPDHRSTFVANARRLDVQLVQLRDREAQLRPAVIGTPVAMTEPVPGYLLAALGLDDLTPQAFAEAVEEGEDVSVSTLAATLALAHDHEIAVLVYNEQTSGVITTQFVDAARAAGIPVVGVTETMPEGLDYVAWMRDNLDRLAAALSA
jgi:zinc/manganese transport system substrate-binding protein